MVKLFSTCNPHGTFELIFDGEHHLFDRTADQKKWSPNDPLVCHWYDPDEFGDLLRQFINVSPDMSVNAFLKMFDGFKSPPKQKKACLSLGINTRDGLQQFMNGDNDIASGKVKELISTMQSISKEVKPTKLGHLNPDHLKKIIGDSDVYEHRKSNGYTEWGLPYTMDVVFKKDEGHQFEAVDIALNHSALIDGRFESQDILLESGFISYHDPVRLFIHIACPQFKFMGKGKNRIELDPVIFEDLSSKIGIVAKEWIKIKKRTRREIKAYWKEKEAVKKEEKSQFIPITEAVPKVAESAYMEASYNNTLHADNRQVYYKARDEILRLTGRSSLDQGYFSDLLKEFQRDNPELTSDWKILYNPRGTFIEPHTGEHVPIGTEGVEQYTQSINQRTKDFKFGAVLLIEKEGFDKLLESFQIPNKWDVGIMGIKGIPTEAARDLISAFHRNGIKVMVLHDFDLAGLRIKNLCHTDTKNYQFQEDVSVIDIGLRLEDIEAMNLKSEPVSYGGKNARQEVLTAGGTEAEADFLVRSGYSKNWKGERVEINAMDSKTMIDFIEDAFIKHGVKKAVPDTETLSSQFIENVKASLIRRATDDYRERIENAIESALDRIEMPDIEPPENIKEIISEQITGTTDSWARGLSSLSGKYGRSLSIKDEFERLISEEAA